MAITSERIRRETKRIGLELWMFPSLTKVEPPKIRISNVIDQPNFDPDGFCFAVHKGIPIGTACAWTRGLRGKTIGYIDMLAVLPEHRGYKLGKWLTVFVLGYFKARGVASVMLDTDDFRLPAIKNYLNLGFVPICVREGHNLRWRNVFEKLGLPKNAIASILQKPYESP